MLIVRPQNQNSYTGHLLYRGSAPIFVTTKLQGTGAMEMEIGRARAEGRCSEAWMLLRRLRVYRFTQDALRPGHDIAACAHCFAAWVLAGHGEWLHRQQEGQ